MKFLSKVLIVVPFLLMSCSGSQITKTATPTPPVRAIDSTCVDKVNEAFLSSTPVVGSFDCLSAGVQKVFEAYFNVVDDASFAAWISTYGPQTSEDCGNAKPYDANHNYKDFHHSGGSVVRYYFRQSDGRVDGLQVASPNGSSSVITNIPPTCASAIKWPKAAFTE